MNNPYVPSHRYRGQEKGVPARGIYFPRGNKISWQKQNYGFYLFDKSWYLPAKHVICHINPLDFSLTAVSRGPGSII